MHEGRPAFTEFSSSNGGWTVAGDDALPGREAGHLGPGQPVGATGSRRPKIEAAYPAIGDFQRLRVLKRDGHGAWNGRVIRLRIVGSRG